MLGDMTGASQALDSLIDRYHSGNRLRVWSLVITVFGDAIVPRGGTVGMTALQELTDRMRIAPGALRAALSRLAKDGWVERDRLGRRSYYRLTPGSAATVLRAARRIYAPGPPYWDGGWTIAIAPEEPAPRRDARAGALSHVGFVKLSNGLFIRPDAPGRPSEDPALAEMFTLSARAGNVPGWVLQTCSDPGTDAAYGVLVSSLQPLERALSRGESLEPRESMVARTLLIHEWRRVLLRDADLPAELRPPGWTGEAARTLVKRLYARLIGPSESWLDDCDGRPDGPLPKPQIELRRRFADR